MMNVETYDGGPAYPISIPGCGDNGASGMSMLDAFAIAALNMMASAVQDESITSLEDQADDTARACYTIARAMLRAKLRAAAPPQGEPR